VDGLNFHRLRRKGITNLEHFALTGRPGWLLYHSNCVLTLDNPGGRITHALPLNRTGADPGFAVLRIRYGAGLVLAFGSSAVVN
jgi:hypothetical protein